MTSLVLDSIPWRAVAGPLAAAEDAVARLDATLAASPIRAGWIARTHFADAAASLWLDGHRVGIEDLVLHDARMDARAPTPDLTEAHGVLRARRRVLEASPDWALSRAAIAALRGKSAPAADAPTPGNEPSAEAEGEADDGIEDGDFARELAAIDALIARSGRVLAGETVARAAPVDETFVVRDRDWDEDARLAEWRAALDAAADLPPLLAAAVAARAWIAFEPLRHGAWLGRLLAAALARGRGKTRAHLACLNSGLMLVPRQARASRDATTALIATLDAFRAGAEAGMRDHERWLTAKTLLARKLVDKRRNSKLPALVDLVLARPLVSAGMIAGELRVTPRAAQDMVRDLGLREMTGRGRYRAWGVL